MCVLLFNVFFLSFVLWFCIVSFMCIYSYLFFPVLPQSDNSVILTRSIPLCVITIGTEEYVILVAQSVWRLATSLTVRGSNPGEGRFSAPVQTGPGAHPTFCTMGTGSFLGVENGRGVTMTPHPF
jgi:hypothetical protein